MTKTLVLETDDGTSEFAMRPLDRTAGQRSRKKLAVDAQGRECRRALMTHDGLLMAAGAVAALYEDSEGNAVESGNILQTDSDGNTLRNLPATLGRPQRPVGPVGPEELLDHVAVKAYTLSPLVLARDLAESLGNGAIYRVACRARPSPADMPSFLLGNGHGVFLLQCRPCLAEFVRHDQPVLLEEDLDDEDDFWEDWSMNASHSETGDDSW